MIYKKKPIKIKKNLLILLFTVLFAFLTFYSYAIYFLLKWQKTLKQNDAKINTTIVER
jgi:sensor domain CHASE-containing protein